jgi:hypothetical protein
MMSFDTLTMLSRVEAVSLSRTSTEFRVRGTGYRVQSTEYRVQSTEYRVQSEDYRVRSSLTSKTVLPILLFSLLLLGADSGGQNGEERAALLKQQKQLSARIEKLTREQDYLVFQKAMYALDSKYLVIDMSKKSGQLRYKNRLLLGFHLKRVSGRGSKLGRGALTLTQKIEGSWKRNLLVFGDALVLQGRKASAKKIKKGILRYSLTKRNFNSVYYAIEPGAKAYILP